MARRRFRLADFTLIDSRPLTLTAAAVEAGRGFSALLVVEDAWSGDGRIIEANALTWRDLPLPFTYMPESSDFGHEGSVIVGRIDEIVRDGANLRATGVFDTSDIALEVIRLREADMLRGVSVELDEIEATLEIVLATPEDGEVDEDGFPVPQENEDGDEVITIPLGEDRLRVSAARIIGATITPTPAFQEASFDLEPLSEPEPDTPEAEAASAWASWRASRSASLTASIPASPPAEWFADPGFSCLTPLSITEDGRVFGHVAGWNSCHIGFQDQCVTPPRSASGYALFHTGEIRCADGSTLGVGHITLGTSHAPLRGLNPRAAAEHYENTGSVVADVRAGEDRFGPWIAGSLRPTATDEEVRALRASGLSGDWRRSGAALEMVAVLAVNVPGFPIPRELAASGHPTSPGHVETARVLTSGDNVLALQAFGPSASPCSASGLSLAQTRIIALSMASRLGRTPAERAAALRRRVHRGD